MASCCALKWESAFTELGLTPEQDRFIACFSPLQTKACCAAEKVDATTLPHPWIGSEQGSADSHEDHRFHYFLDHSHPSLDDEILPCHVAVTVMTAISTIQFETVYSIVMAWQINPGFKPTSTLPAQALRCWS